jgi:hypothetical protein
MKTVLFSLTPRISPQKTSYNVCSTSLLAIKKQNKTKRKPTQNHAPNQSPGST